jgi:antitoxin ParD1/3/4
MPTRNVSLTKELDQFVASRVEGGKYANASEVMRTALRLLEGSHCRRRSQRSCRGGRL